MPIDINSDEWKTAESRDSIQTEILNLLVDNNEQAFSIKEIDEYLLEEHPHVFPGSLIDPDPAAGAQTSRQALIGNVLESRFWHSEVEFKYLPTEGDLYFTWSGVGINPIAEVDEVTDPEPDSPFLTLESRFRNIEQDVDDEVSELKERISHLEYRLREELDSY